ncbi:MAG: 2-oxoacid:acceptor oxidoreductase family protein [Candidatus Falkowbacteria bacterium]|nr:2-oxoacid:acceptor oxidoreductase family protein [Candidatus Falkowbacteria bacterium]
MQEVRIHGRGGQGVVTGAELIAAAGFFAGLEAQAFPLFGVERSGAPISAFARLSNKAIITRDQVYHPDFLIIQDHTLLGQAHIFSGISERTLVIVNSENSPKEISLLIKKETGIKINEKNIHCAPATEIALRIIGRNIVNTVILGTFIKASKLFPLKNLELAISEKFQEKGKEIINKNLIAVREAYDYQK